MAKQRKRTRRPARGRPHRSTQPPGATSGFVRNIGRAVNWAWNNRKTLSGVAKQSFAAYDKWKKTGRTRITRGTKGSFKQSIQGTSQHNDTSTRYFRVVIRKGRRGTLQRLMNRKHHFKYTEDWQIIATSAEGRQGTQFLKTIGSKQQVFGSPLSTARNDSIGTARSYYEMNPYRANTGSVIFPPGIPATPMSNDRIYYKSITGTLKVINLTSLATHVKIYWLMYKRDAFWAPDNIWDHALTDEAMGSVANIPAALPATALATPGAALRTNIGQNPFHLRMFKQYFKVLQKKVYYLQGGDEVDTNFKFEYNKLLDKSVFEEYPTTADPIQFLANFTIVPYVIFNGSLAGIGTPAVEVAPGAAKLGFYINQTHEFGPVPAELKTPTQNYFPGALEGANVERQIDDVDQAVAVAVA